MSQRWYVIKTKPQCEYLAAAALEREDFRLYFPRVRSPRPQRGARRPPSLPWLPVHIPRRRKRRAAGGRPAARLARMGPIQRTCATSPGRRRRGDPAPRRGDKSGWRSVDAVWRWGQSDGVVGQAGESRRGSRGFGVPTFEGKGAVGANGPSHIRGSALAHTAAGKRRGPPQ